MKKLLLLSALSLASLAAQAQEAAPANLPFNMLKGATPEAVEDAQRTGADVARDLLNAYETLRTPQMEQLGTQQRRRADDIADAAMSAERDKVLDFLGLDPQSSSALYFFVSWSMPIEMLRSYAIEAMWSGGIMLFKGVPPGKEIGTFVLKDLQELVYGKGAAANISIDPRLFDAYDIQTVPSIVFTTVRSDMSCQGINPVLFRANDMDLSYDTCPKLDPSVYSKMTGAVTTSYALQTFIEDGRPQAQPHLTALSRGWTQGQTPGKVQKPFSGKWEAVLTPSERQQALEMMDTATRAAPSTDSPTSQPVAPR